MLGERSYLEQILIDSYERVDRQPDDWGARNSLGIDLIYLDRLEEAEAQFLVITDAKGDTERVKQLGFYNLACTASLKGQKEQAIGFLEEAYRRDYLDWVHMELDRDLANVRSEPGYRRLLLVMRERVARAQTRFRRGGNRVDEVVRERGLELEFGAGELEALAAQAREDGEEDE
jgi:hypothetical protein